MPSYQFNIEVYSRMLCLPHCIVFTLVSFAPWMSHRVAVEVSVVVISTPCLQLHQKITQATLQLHQHITQTHFAATPEDSTGNFAATPVDNTDNFAAAPEDNTDICAAIPEDNAEIVTATPEDNTEISAVTPEENTGNFVVFPPIFLLLVLTLHSEALDLLKALISPLVRTNNLK